MTRPLYQISLEIQSDWKRPYFGAVPYIAAMQQLLDITDHYGLDPADDIVRYFLSNANTWRGETARRVKAELKEMIGIPATPKRSQTLKLDDVDPEI